MAHANNVHTIAINNAIAINNMITSIVATMIPTCNQYNNCNDCSDCDYWEQKGRPIDATMTASTIATTVIAKTIVIDQMMMSRRTTMPCISMMAIEQVDLTHKTPPSPPSSLGT